MRLTRHVVIAGVLLCFTASAGALESDQFTLPPEPLADIGPEYDAHVSDIIDDAVKDVNGRIVEMRTKLKETKSKHWISHFTQELKQYRRPRPILKAVRQRTGTGIPSCTLEKWVNKYAFEARPAQFKLAYGDTVFGGSAVFKPLLLVAMAPTVKSHGIRWGTDKVGHIFQQGWEYYSVYEKKRARGKSHVQACRAAADNGLAKEKSVYGKWWTGVVSNADLAANYAGLMFYLNLTQPVKRGKKTWPPILVMKDSLWQRNPEANHVLEPFITEHFSEALNPCAYDGAVRGSIRKALQERGEAWVRFHKTDRTREVARLRRVKTWFGEYYGHQESKDMVTIVNSYFDVAQAKEKQASSQALARAGTDYSDEDDAAND